VVAQSSSSSSSLSSEEEEGLAAGEAGVSELSGDTGAEGFGSLARTVGLGPEVLPM